MLEIKLFGPGQARYQGELLEGFPTHRWGQLLAYLLLHRGVPLHRERVATVFWRGCATARSRKYLRDALWRLRKALNAVGAAADDYLAVSDDSVAFSPSADFQLDVEEFENTVQRLLDTPAEDLTAEQGQALERAVEHYQGDLLEGTFEDWCLNDRERFRLQYLSSLEKLTSLHQNRGRVDSAITFARRLLEHDQTREDIARRLMRMLWQRGDRSGALEQYAALQAVLQQHLGVQPTWETTQLYRQIRAGEPVGNAGAQHEEGAPATAAEIPPEKALSRLRQLRHALGQTNRELRKLEQSFKLALSDGQES